MVTTLYYVSPALSSLSLSTYWGILSHNQCIINKSYRLNKVQVIYRSFEHLFEPEVKFTYPVLIERCGGIVLKTVK